MTITVAAALLKAFSKCPICDRTMMMNDLIIDEYEMDMKCRCGWRLRIKEDKVVRSEE